jgi:hypothetical protein
MPRLLVALTLGLALASRPALGQQVATPERILDVVPSLEVRELDSALPVSTLEHWLRGLGAPDADVEWAVTDCGEDDGGGVTGERTLPLCAEGVVVARDGARIVVEVVAGSSSGADRERATTLSDSPRMWTAAVLRGDEVVLGDRLSDLIGLAGRCVPRVAETEVNRRLPHGYHDQGRASIDVMYPAHRVLASRRSGQLDWPAGLLATFEAMAGLQP